MEAKIKEEIQELEQRNEALEGALNRLHNSKKMQHYSEIRANRRRLKKLYDYLRLF